MAMPTQNPTPKTVTLRPRYLRAIPSLVVLTTAMAWGAFWTWMWAMTCTRKRG